MVSVIVGREQRHAGSSGDAMQPRQAALVVAAIQQARRKPYAIRGTTSQSLQHLQRFRLLEAMRQRESEKLPFGKFQEIIDLQVTLALFGAIAALAAGEQLAETAVGRAIARIDQDVRRAVHEDQPRSDQKLWLVRDVGIIEFLVGPHHAGQRVVIGDADDGKPQVARLLHIGARIRSPAQERKIRRDADFRVSRRGHANNPCMYQFGCTARPSSCTISRS
jgi:hypothetical protein